MSRSKQFKYSADAFKLKSIKCSDTIECADDAMEVIMTGVDSLENHIFYYAFVDRLSSLQFVKTFKKIEKAMILKNKMNDTNDPIVVHINSEGGYLLDAIPIMEHIRNSAIPVVTVVEGCSASAATLISIVGHQRIITKYSFMLIHQLSSSAEGTHEELKDAQQNNETLMELMKGLYMEYAKIPKKKLEQILKQDIWLDSATCKKYKLVDEVV